MQGGPPRYGEGSTGDAGEVLLASHPSGLSVEDRVTLLGLRYFTPREIARLHSFPEDFAFPSDLTLRQRYACLGNSLSVLIVADLLAYLLLGEQQSGQGGVDPGAAPRLPHK
jgi:site-specific DNA-cytosine methylase